MATGHPVSHRFASHGVAPDAQGGGAHAAQDIAAVVVTHNSASTIDRCLHALRLNRGLAQLRVIDNASDDATLAIVQRHALQDRRVQFVANPDNPGFAVACNQGAQACTAAWLAFVNPDCYLQPDTLWRLMQHAASLVPAALVGADLVDDAGRHDPAARRRDPDFVAMLRRPAAARLAVPQAPESLQRVDAVSGAVMLLPRTLFRQVGGFDAGYRLHAEDLDLCRRVREHGAAVAVANDVAVMHVRGVSSRARPWFVEWHKHRGLWRYFTKFQAAQVGWPVRLLVAGAISLRFVQTSLRLAAAKL